MRILVVYYSFTLAVEKLAQSIEACLVPRHQVTVSSIRPLQEKAYWHWLLLSLVPGSSVAIADLPNPTGFDRVCLGFPKWTFSCPPLIRYLSTWHQLSSDIPVGLFMSFGGFDEDRYLRSIASRVSRNARLVTTLAVRRKLVNTPESLSLTRRFCDALVNARSLVSLKLDSVCR